MMDAFNHYHPNDDTARSFGVLFVITSVSVFLLLMWDVQTLLMETGSTLANGNSLVLLSIWHIVCMLLGLSAMVFMFRMKTGHMVVRSHEQKKDILIHPLGINKFVTFSSWTLILNVLYFSLATLVSFIMLTGANPPAWLTQSLGGVFVTALGASFLTSTVVRYVILPRNENDDEHHRRQFWFHNQMMHNFCTIFLVVEILLTTPQLEFGYLLFGILIGLTYALFAFPFAIFGGGYYCYSFIDPRLQNAPLFITMLALAISLSYVGVWIVSQLISFNYILGSVLLVVWCSQIIQFSQNNVRPG